jgi:hypothetical protein
VWAGPLAGGDTVVLMFNRNSPAAVDIAVDWTTLGFAPSAGMKASVGGDGGGGVSYCGNVWCGVGNGALFNFSLHLSPAIYSSLLRFSRLSLLPCRCGTSGLARISVPSVGHSLPPL